MVIAVWPSLAAAARTHAARRTTTRHTRTAAHLAALERHGLTPDTCPVCRICPDLPDNPRSKP